MRQGFTFVESLVVMAIILSLAALMLPSFARARQAAHRTSEFDGYRHFQASGQSAQEREEQSTLQHQIGAY